MEQIASSLKEIETKTTPNEPFIDHCIKHKELHQIKNIKKLKIKFKDRKIVLREK